MTQDELRVPGSIRKLVEQPPAEDIALRVLREAMPDVPIRSRIPAEPELWPTKEGLLIVCRRGSSYGTWGGETRFVNHAGIEVQVFAYGPDAEERAALAHEACRVAFRDAMIRQDYYPGLGSISWHYMQEEPRRKADWATATGPVQYADLPSGWERYEARHQLFIRRPIWG